MNIQVRLNTLGSYALLFAVLAGIIMVPVMLFWGIAAVAEFLSPLFSVLMGLSIGIFIVFILPLSLFRHSRPGLPGISLLLSMICAATVWMYSFLAIIKEFRWFAVFLIFIFKAVTPLALLILLVRHQWGACAFIAAGLIFTYAMRFYSARLVKPRPDIIDI